MAMGLRGKHSIDARAEIFKKYGRCVPILRGKDRESNLTILEALSTREMSIWELARHSLASPTRQKIGHSHSMYFRRIKGSKKRGERVPGLEELGYVERRGFRTSKGREIPVYGLALKGTFVAALSPKVVEKGSLEKFFENAYPNPFCSLGKILLEKGVDEKFVRELFIEGIKEAVCSGALNLREDGLMLWVANLLLQNKLLIMKDGFRRDLESLEKVVDALETPEAKEAMSNFGRSSESYSTVLLMWSVFSSIERKLRGELREEEQLYRELRRRMETDVKFRGTLKKPKSMINEANRMRKRLERRRTQEEKAQNRFDHLFTKLRKLLYLPYWVAY